MSDANTGTNTIQPLVEGYQQIIEFVHPSEIIDASYSSDVDEATKVAELGEILREIIVWMTSGNRNRPDYSMMVFKKCIAFAWVVRPEVFQGKSLRAVSMENGCRVGYKKLSWYARAFADRFGMNHGGMKTPEARAKLRRTKKEPRKDAKKAQTDRR